jgi:hypothetical protein
MLDCFFRLPPSLPYSNFLSRTVGCTHRCKFHPKSLVRDRPIEPPRLLTSHGWLILIAGRERERERERERKGRRGNSLSFSSEGEGASGQGFAGIKAAPRDERRGRTGPRTIDHGFCCAGPITARFILDTAKRR